MDFPETAFLSLQMALEELSVPKACLFWESCSPSGLVMNSPSLLPKACVSGGESFREGDKCVESLTGCEMS